MAPIRTLVLEADGSTRKAIAADTLLRGVLRLDRRVVPARWRAHPAVRKLLGPRYDSTGYIADWRDAVMAEPALDVEAVNINNLVEYRRARRRIREYPLVIILHSAAGDSMDLLRRTADWFVGRRGTLAIFIGNEYDLMVEKIGFCRDASVDFICSQLPIDSARWLYADAATSRVLPMPHGLNPEVYRPAPDVARTIDIGFIGDVYGHFIGDVERTRLIRHFQEHGAEMGLRCEIRSGRLPRHQWVEFLQRCRGIIGAESGTYYLDRTGTLIPEVLAWCRLHPEAPFEEVRARFFAGRAIEHSGKAISSRHFEPIGTRTCQLLLDGDYNGILEADEHYIAIRKDLSNLAEALERFGDEGYRAAMADRAYEHVLANHTYRHRIRDFVSAVAGAPRGAAA